MPIKCFIIIENESILDIIIEKILYIKKKKNVLTKMASLERLEKIIIYR